MRPGRRFYPNIFLKLCERQNTHQPVLLQCPQLYSFTKNTIIMRKCLIPALLLMLMGCWLDGIAQKTSKTTKPVAKKKTVARKTTTRKPATPPEPVEADVLLQMEDDKNLYMGKTGEQLVYEVNAGGKVYDFIVTQRPTADGLAYVFDWEMTAPVNRSGRVRITKEAAYDSRRYNNFFSGGDLTLSEASTVWFTGVNFSDMPEKKTTIQLDDNAAETFYRRDDAETDYTILYKGKTVKLDVFVVSNSETGTGSNRLWIQNISSFPLIVKMDLGWSIRLKEVR
jgi:hypothetical protein